MLFNSYIFLILFLPIVYSLTRVIKKFKNHSIMFVWLSLASLMFYGYWDVRYVALIVFSIICNFGCGKLIKRNIACAKFWLVSGVIFNLILLGYFKLH